MTRLAKARIVMEVSRDLVGILDRLATQECVTRVEIVRRAISVIVEFDTQRRLGRTHLGFARSPEGLDGELVGVLTSMPAGDAEKERDS